MNQKKCRCFRDILVKSQGHIGCNYHLEHHSWYQTLPKRKKKASILTPRTSNLLVKPRAHTAAWSNASISGPGAWYEQRCSAHVHSPKGRGFVARLHSGSQDDSSSHSRTNGRNSRWSHSCFLRLFGSKKGDEMWWNGKMCSKNEVEVFSSNFVPQFCVSSSSTGPLFEGMSSSIYTSCLNRRTSNK